MKAEVGIAEGGQESKGPQLEPVVPGRARRGKRRTSQAQSSGNAVRFFLAKSAEGGTPTLDREFESESEAIVESLKTGKHYFVLSEWKGLADLTKKIPVIRKEAVGQKRMSSI